MNLAFELLEERGAVRRRADGSLLLREAWTPPSP